MATIKSGATTDQWTIDPTSKAGRVTLYDASGNLITSLTKPDASISGNLNALNAAVVVPFNGQYGAGFSLVAGTLVGTLVAELSYDGGASFPVQTQFYDSQRDAYLPSVTFGVSNGAIGLTIDSAAGATHARVRVSAFTSGTATATISATTVARGHVVATLLDGGKPTYRFAVKGFTPIAGLFALIQGSATKTVRIARIGLSIAAATGATVDVSLQRFSAIAGGTIAVTPAAAKADNNDPAATSVVTQYSVTPTTQTANGGIYEAKRYEIVTAGVAVPIQELIFTFAQNARACVLRGTSDWLGILLSAAGTTPVGDMWVELTEE
jgi:hypothetical protein